MPQIVLVVEDDPSLRNGLARLLKMNGHEVFTAASIAEGLHQLSADPAVLLLDMNLPDGEGTTILRRVRDEKLPIRVAVLSGSGDNQLMAEARALKPEAVFKKPPNWDEVMKWIAG